jgi:hypothetical protein
MADKSKRAAAQLNPFTETPSSFLPFRRRRSFSLSKSRLQTIRDNDDDSDKRTSHRIATTQQDYFLSGKTT